MASVDFTPQGCRAEPCNPQNFRLGEKAIGHVGESVGAHFRILLLAKETRKRRAKPAARQEGEFNFFL
jgi:hypothetical protein